MFQVTQHIGVKSAYREVARKHHACLSIENVFAIQTPVAIVLLSRSGPPQPLTSNIHGQYRANSSAEPVERREQPVNRGGRRKLPASLAVRLLTTHVAG
jgi:hypothetical protein